MIVKFFRRGTGAGSGVIDYLLGKNRDREDARLLYGDPLITEQLINTTNYKQRYKSGVLSFEEQATQFTEQQKRDIMQKFERTIFTGLEHDQYDILWVEHSDKNGRLELNFVIPCQELRSGKRLQPFYAAADLVRVNAFKNIINTEYKLSNPDDPRRKRLANPHADNAPRSTQNNEDKSSPQAIKEAINHRMLEQLQQGALNNRQQVLQTLGQLGLRIERKTKKSISVSHPSMKKNIRLKGGIYEESFMGVKSEPHIIQQFQRQYDAERDRRHAHDIKTWQKGLEIKTAYHRELYGDITPPAPIELNKLGIQPDNNPVTALEPKQEAPTPSTPSYTPSFRP